MPSKTFSVDLQLFAISDGKILPFFVCTLPSNSSLIFLKTTVG